MAESLPVRYRPRRFADVAGQVHVCTVLRSAAARQRPPQQVLLAGPSGLGKTTTARIFAAALLCEHRAPDGDACGLCEQCLLITGPRGGHPDVVELDAASNGGKDEIRALAERAVLAPLRGRWKVYIVDEAHGLTGPGGQAFLRLLEEPPAHCVFVLATTDPGKLPTALQGRCLYLQVVPPTREQVLANLRRVAAGEDWEPSAQVLDAVVAASDPALGVRGTVATLEKLAGPLSDGADLTAADLEAYLGVVAADRVSAVTSAIGAADVAGAVTGVTHLVASAGRSVVRRQLVDWAQERLVAAARAGEPLAGPVHTLGELLGAGDDEASLVLAVARAAAGPAPSCAPAQPDDPRGAPADAATTSKVSAPVAGAGPDHSPAAPAQPAVRASAAPAPTAPREVPVKDPVAVALLNQVGKINARAAFVLSKSRLTDTGHGLEVTVPAALAARAAECRLAEALEQVSTADRPVRLA